MTIDKRTEKLSDRMKSEAVSLGLCAQWTSEWVDGTTKDDMLEKFVNGIDFCISHNWPSPKVIKRDFGDVMHNHGVYVDENVDEENPKMVILNGECVAHLRYTGMGVGEVYVRHSSSLYLKVKGLSRVFVNLLDDGDVHIECEDGAKCFVYQYGGNVSSCSGPVTVRDRKDFHF